MVLYAHILREGQEKNRTIPEEFHHADAMSGVEKLLSKL
jgi:hypothetical protein